MTDEMRAGLDFGSGMIMAGPGALYARPAASVRALWALALWPAGQRGQA